MPVVRDRFVDHVAEGRFGRSRPNEGAENGKGHFGPDHECREKMQRTSRSACAQIRRAMTLAYGLAAVSRRLLPEA